MPSRLARRLDLGDAVVVGLGSMLGAGVFVAIGPAADAAGAGLLIGLAIAAGVAYCNATSSARLAAAHPASGGAYVYGRERLGPLAGYVAGWGFVVGKIASCAAIALTIGAYTAPAWQRPIAVAAVVGLTVVNDAGVRKTARVTRVIVAVVLVALVLVVVGALFGGTASVERFDDLGIGGAGGILRAAALLFFAFAGYARIATLGEEVVDPARTIPTAIGRALGIVFAVYVVVAVSVLAAVGPDAIARSETPLATAVAAGRLDALVPAARIGAAVAGLGVLLSLVAGVSRTTFAMAADRELPAWLAAVHPTQQVPHRAVRVTGGIVVVLVLVADLRGAIGFSSFCVLVYYAIANAAAWRLPARRRTRTRLIAASGLAGCVVLAATLPVATVATGIGVLAAGIVVRAVTTRPD